MNDLCNGDTVTHKSKRKIRTLPQWQKLESVSLPFVLFSLERVMLRSTFNCFILHTNKMHAPLNKLRTRRTNKKCRQYIDDTVLWLTALPAKMQTKINYMHEFIVLLWLWSTVFVRIFSTAPL